ncbi:transcriptional regulator [Halobacteroides halobius DSM 5150]|uniref:Transcriptional regulator n=1 Tax=Halobacteroides halobius (strain ATCC 35273 / DSM 5150 / MD-1) TaxID=748449 RepID=L0K822_HALHC|nr:GntR family transcriptional regulator [Halobacteroides halobius]AGB40263.1 transcriptional regulator [Halobacteroides halobius DSM 5150]
MNKIRLDEDSPIPLYYQLENLIREKIENGKYKVGDKIPSERKFSEKVNLSRMTIRKAIGNLVEKGILERRRGQGTFVSDSKLDSFPGLIGFNEHIEMKNMTPSSKVIEQKTIPANYEIAENLKIEEGEEVILTSRLRLADGNPIGFEKSYIPYYICPKLKEIDLSQGSIYQTLTAEGYKPNKANQEIEAILADKHITELLGGKVDQPILKNTRVTFSGNTRVEFSFNFYRGDKYSIHTTLSDL